MFIDLPRSCTSGSSQREGGFPSSKETRVLIFDFLVTANDIVIPFWLGHELRDHKVEVRRGVF